MDDALFVVGMLMLFAIIVIAFVIVGLSINDSVKEKLPDRPGCVLEVHYDNRAFGPDTRTAKILCEQ